MHVGIQRIRGVHCPWALIPDCAGMTLFILRIRYGPWWSLAVVVAFAADRNVYGPCRVAESQVAMSFTGMGRRESGK